MVFRVSADGAGGVPHRPEPMPGPSGRPRTHAVYPGTFDPFTRGHLDVADRARRLFDRLTVLVAVNPDKHPAVAQQQRLAALRSMLPASWTSVAVTAWSGLTATYCRENRAGVIIRGIRGQADLPYEYQLAAMNEALGVTTLLLPARPELARVSSTASRAHRI